MSEWEYIEVGELVDAMKEGIINSFHLQKEGETEDISLKIATSDKAGSVIITDTPEKAMGQLLHITRKYRGKNPG